MFKQGNIYWYNFGNDDVKGVIKKVRPCVIVSNDVFNTHSSVVNIVAVSHKNNISPVHVKIINHKINGYAMCEQIFTVSKDSLFTNENSIDKFLLNKILKAIQFQVSEIAY